ncbi:AAA family ATPase [Clostridium butyricum]|uniref:AAA family ATPase n=1 Tax=Clostridium butyricum TaxID=1492 RepID=UPI000903FEA5|nr:AAA family ATPase [Clostridium butyricum]APF23553.1 ABC transporter family protein [Clostridium butyricum]
MKLLYVYIESFGELLKNEDFKFSNEYTVEYLSDNKILNIDKNSNYFEEFYGNVISDVTAIVGKNGVGKTTLLDLIGRNLKDRLQLSNVNKRRKIMDKYFLIYHVEENIFYLESVGNIIIQNLAGYEKLLNENSTVFHSFYFKGIGLDYQIIQYDNEVRDKILYINNDYDESSDDLFTVLIKDEKKDLFLPRVYGDNFSLVEWYLIYLDLYKENMVNSSNITILFSKNDNVNYESFIIQPKVKECQYEIDNKISYIQENIDDFYSHFVSCIVNYFKKSSLNICEEKIAREWNKLIHKYSGKNTYVASEYKTIFEECTNIIENNKSILKLEEAYLLIKYIELVRDLFFALYDIKDYIIPGIREFKLKLSGKYLNDKVHNFFKCFIEVKELIEYNFGNYKEKEDWEYKKDNYLHTYDGNTFKLESPIDVCRINISTGERNLIELLSKIAYEVKSYSEIQMLRLSSVKKTFIILVDEIEAAMHLEWSRNLMSFIIKYIEKQTLVIGTKPFFYSELGIQVQLIFTTHSPFLLSDLNKNSIIALELKNRLARKKKDICAFAQNIQRVMNNEFFIEDCYGAFAQNKIQRIIERLNNVEDLSDVEKKSMEFIIQEIGEPILRNKLNEIYMHKLLKDTNIGDEEIKLISKVKSVYKNLNNKDIIEKLKMLLEDPN